MKTRLMAIFLSMTLLAFAPVLAACGEKEDGDQSVLPGGDRSAQEVFGENESKDQEEGNNMIFWDEQPSSQPVGEGEFTPVAEIDGEYVKERENGMVYVNVLAPQFAVSGIEHPSENAGEYYRLDASAKGTYSAANASLAVCTAGAQVRFRTDAAKIVIRITLRNPILNMHHFSDRGVYGIDLYTGTGTDRDYLGAAMQTFADSTTYNEQTVTLPGRIQEITVNLPLYSGVSELVIGFPENAGVALPTDRATDAPIAFYGSSITQGGCVSRPGNMYSHILCRALNADCLNLGFSGSALGEQSVAEYLAGRDISAFVMDYDYNSESAQTLRDTHYPFYKTVREAHPDIPIIFVTHPYYTEPTSGDIARINVIRDTYERAMSEGDKNVYFVDSETFFPTEMRDLYAVDLLHPNDLGHFMMAKAIYPVLKNALFGN